MPASNAFLVTIDGQPLPSDIEGLMTSAVVDDSLRLPDLFTLRFRDPDHSVVAKSNVKVGSLIAVKVQTADGQTPDPLMQGEVTALEVEFDALGTFLVVRGFDQAHRLFRGRRSASYTQVTASDAVQKVAQRAGLKVGTITSTSTVFDHLSQFGTNDWDFVEGLAREIGFQVTVQDGALSFGKPTASATAPAANAGTSTDPLVLEQGRDLLRFRAVVTSAEQVKDVEVRGWDVDTKTVIKSTKNATTVSAQLSGASPADLAKAFGDPTYVASDIPFRKQSEVDGAAGALAEQIAGAFAEFEGVARGNPKLRAGQAISIDNLGAPFDGKYTITTSRHRYEPDTGYTVAFAVTGRQERSLYGLTGGGGGNAQQVAIGQVTDAKDPQKLGRVKVKFPWLSDDFVTDWARTVQPGAGKGRGNLFVPEVDDEVLVAFEQGDVRRPYVLGGLYNGVDTPPSGEGDAINGAGKVARRSMISRNGHRIDLHDDDGNTEGITVKTGDAKLTLQLDKVNTKITVHSDGTITIEGKQGVVIDAGTAKLDMKASEISLTAQSGVTVDAGGGTCSISGSMIKLN
jgi:phage protein D/phage baseplate assembly protein gpV